MFDPPPDVDVIGFPPTPAENTEQTELEALEAHFKDISTCSSSASSSYGSNDDVSHPANENAPDFLPQCEVFNLYTNARSDAYTFSHADPIPSISDPTPVPPTTQTLFPPPDSRQAQMVDYAVRRLHANLDSRLQPFWSSALSNRMIRLSIFCPHPDRGPSDAQDITDESNNDLEPLATKYVTTSPQGDFQTTFSIPWDQLATHPPTLHIAYGERDIEYPVVVQAEVWTWPQHLPSPSPSPHASPALRSLHRHDNVSRSHSHLLSESLPYTSASSPQPVSAAPRPAVHSHITISLPTAHVPVRLISDIDDTIKHAGVLEGAKHVFRNVFVRHLEELVVHSMVDWYRSLWEKG
jgi:Phosphatidate phosphatase APP1, catalytic domain